jgi:putative PIN family toxin of toxin-antitoxin system
MPVPQIVIDTNVFITALRSQNGAGYRLLMLAGTGKFGISLSVPLVLEYEEVAKRQADELELSPQTIEDIIDYLCSIAARRKIHYLWRPFVPDPKDDMVLEVAVAGQCDYIVTYNQKDFRGADQFGVKVVTPQAFLEEIGELS